MSVLKTLLKVQAPFLLILLLSSTFLTFVISSSYMLNRSAEETVHRFMESTVGFLVVDTSLNESALREIREMSGLEALYEIRRFSSTLDDVGTSRVVMMEDVPKEALPDLIRGRYPSEGGECAVTESSYLEMGSPPLGSEITLKVDDIPIGCRLVGTFAAWSLSPHRRTVLAILDVEPEGKVYLLKLRFGEVGPGIEELIKIVGSRHVRYVGVSEEFALDFLNSYRDLSKLLMVAVTAMSVVGLVAAKLIEMKRQAKIYGLLLMGGRKWSTLTAMDLSLTAVFTLAGTGLGTFLAWRYGILFGEFLTGKSLIDLWKYRWEFLVGSSPYTILLPASTVLSSLIFMWRTGLSETSFFLNES